jgi:hypothetical protein
MTNADDSVAVDGTERLGLAGDKEVQNKVVPVGRAQGLTVCHGFRLKRQPVADFHVPHDLSWGRAVVGNQADGGFAVQTTCNIQFLVSTTTMQAQASPQLYPRPPPPLPTFEFTKRKRWADLLITELTEAIILILSTQCQILYCSAVVKELLGWGDKDLIDTEFLDLVNGAWMCSAWSLPLCHPWNASLVDDRENFKKRFEQSMRDNPYMQSYVRMQAKHETPLPPSTNTSEVASWATEVLFEINGYPHFIEGDDTCKCFFATAKTYPSRNTAM